MVKAFAETLKELEPVDILEKARITDSSGEVVEIPNMPGKAGSLAVYANLLGFNNGKIRPKEASKGLELFSEYTRDANENPGKHPNIDRLAKVVLNQGEFLSVEFVYNPEKVKSNFERFIGLTKEERTQIRNEIRRNVKGLVSLLENGSVRSAEKIDGEWKANSWVKNGILFGFAASDVVPMEYGPIFMDKELYPPISPSKIVGVRVVPGGTSMRSGSYLASGVIIMPPTYVNIGAYVDSGTMLDSHSLVGSCAQVGKKAHISAGAIIGGVLEHANAVPCIVEDGAFMGINSSISEGTIIRENAILAPGLNLSRSLPVFDRTKREYVEKIDGRTVIPVGAVVVPGSKAIYEDTSGQISQGIAIITKYRDAKTDIAVALEEALRSR